MKQFTLIEQDRYIKIDGTGIFFTPEDWPFTDIEHLWAIQWKDDGTPDGEGWVEYDSAIPNTPIAKCQIEKYVNHHTTELNKQIDEQKRKEEERTEAIREAIWNHSETKTYGGNLKVLVFTKVFLLLPYGSRAA